MKRLLSTGVIGLALTGLLVMSCSELKDYLPSPVASQTVAHPPSWMDTTSIGFHGKVISSGQARPNDCRKCHSGNYTGGLSRVSCFSCHALYPHLSGWTDSSTALFHGDYIQSRSWDLQSCIPCHGRDFNGGGSGVSCYKCHDAYPHNTDWTSPVAPNSHGRFLKAKSWDNQNCAGCHGATFTGGNTGVSCLTCHPTYPHSVTFPPPGYHPAYLTANGFPLTQCQQCHGTSYTGGAVVNVSCSNPNPGIPGLKCHVNPDNSAKSPESCNTCHGDISASASLVSSWAPPRTIAGDTARTVRGVGAHQAHFETDFAQQVQCQECHTVPASVSAAGHIDAQPYRATVGFNGPLGRLVTGNGTYVPNPSYDGVANTCSNTYCHGNWRARKATSSYMYMYADSVMRGENASPIWTGGSSQYACGTCHGLPPKGHWSVTPGTCGVCHTNQSGLPIVDANGNIVDPSKHINGKINVFGTEYGF